MEPHRLRLRTRTGHDGGRDQITRCGGRGFAYLPPAVTHRVVNGQTGAICTDPIKLTAKPACYGLSGKRLEASGGLAATKRADAGLLHPTHQPASALLIGDRGVAHLSTGYPPCARHQKRIHDSRWGSTGLFMRYPGSDRAA